MHIFIDESGTFAASSKPHSISIVGALIIPEGRLRGCERKFATLRRSLPISDGEVKGRTLSEAEIDRVVSLLLECEALFEVTAIDMGIHNKSDIERHKKEQEEGITKYLTDDFHINLRDELWDFRRRLAETPNQLYVQSVVTFELIWRAIAHGTMFYSQRRPRELGSFYWVVDSKGRDQITDWESWWSQMVMPFLQSKSLREPLGMFAEGNYSHFDRFNTVAGEHLRQFAKDPSKDSATDLKKLLTEHFRFSSEPEPGLEMIDILTNATRRALMDRLGPEGWKNIPRLMIHRRHHYIQMVSLARTLPKKGLPYVPVLQHFGHGGRSMLTPRFLKT